MADLTTAQRLAAYRDELRDAGFNDTDVAEFVHTAAPGLVENVQVQQDFDDAGTVVGSVEVRLDPHLDEDEMRRIVERVHGAVRSGTL